MVFFIAGLLASFIAWVINRHIFSKVGQKGVGAIVSLASHAFLGIITYGLFILIREYLYSCINSNNSSYCLE